MKNYTVTLTMKVRAPSRIDAEGIGLGAAEHLLEAYNDDGSIRGTILAYAAPRVDDKPAAELPNVGEPAADLKVRHICRGGEYLTLHVNGCIERHRNNAGPSPAWKVTGAVTLNNFGRTVRPWTLEEILRDPVVIPWTFKNGKQRTYITDLDHGTRRMWASPSHYVC